jgi:hypothetical protein
MADVRAAGGPILADEPAALITLTNKPADYHAFAMKQVWDGGLWDDQQFLRALDSPRFELILLRMNRRAPRVEPYFWNERMASAIARRYDRREAFDIDDDAFVGVYRRRTQAGPIDRTAIESE